MTRLRLVVHALDRTGPPTLARALLSWLVRHRPEIEVDVVAMRGGQQVGLVEQLAPVRVLLHPEEAWDLADPPERRVREIRTSLNDLPSVDASLLVSISGAEALPFLDDRSGVIVTWVVEQEEEFPPGLVERSDVWIAGSGGTAAELTTRIGLERRPAVCPEFVDRRVADAPARDALRPRLGAPDETMVVMGAGIATHRKGIDLFLEVALAARRRRLDPVRFVWIGGERDPLFDVVRAEASRLGLDRFSVLPSVEDVVPWFAAADVFLHTARLDAFPLVCLHAACAGTPVVAFSGAGGTVEMFGEAFIGAPYPDVGALVDRLADLAPPTTRHQAGAAQQQIVHDRYVSERCAPQLISEIEAALRSGSAVG